MKKLMIVLALSISFISCNSNGKNEVARDTPKVGERISADAQQSSIDTNVNKIGTTPIVRDTIGKDSSEN